jgi:hypothetical protein
MCTAGRPDALTLLTALLTQHFECGFNSTGRRQKSPTGESFPGFVDLGFGGIANVRSDMSSFQGPKFVAFEVHLHPHRRLQHRDNPDARLSQ